MGLLHLATCACPEVFSEDMYLYHRSIGIRGITVEPINIPITVFWSDLQIYSSTTHAMIYWTLKVKSRHCLCAPYLFVSNHAAMFGRGLALANSGFLII